MSFQMSRLRRCDQIIGGGAIAFFIFLFFFKWYGGSASSSIGAISYGVSANGWHTFTNSRWIWLLTIIVALGAVWLQASGRRLDGPVHPSVVVTALGALSAVLILYRIIDHPSGGTSGSIAGVHYSASYGIKIGIWLGLIAALAIAYGGYLAMQDEGATLSLAGGQGAGGGAAPPAGGGPPGAPAGAPASTVAGGEGPADAPVAPVAPPLPPPTGSKESPPAGAPPGA
jgi:hypothetical protein